MEREAALVVRVDQLLVRRRGLGEDPEPGERILARRLAVSAVGDGLAADAVEAVAAGDEVAGQLAALVPDDAPLGIDALHGDLEPKVERPVSRRAAIRSFTTSCWP